MAEDLTIAIISLVGGASLTTCIEACRAEADQLLIVARDGTVRDGMGTPMGQAGRADVPARRKRAAELATTPLIGFLEDTVEPARGWALAARAALANDAAAAAGGPVLIGANLPSTARALALTEYGRFGLSNSRAPVRALPGCNFAFRRDELLRAMSPDGLIDTEIFGRLAANGSHLEWAHDMTVIYCAQHREGARLATRFGHGRLYAGRRLAKASPLAKIAGAVKALALPPVFLGRTLREASSAELRSLATLWHAAMQHSAWAAGEFVGALFGPSVDGVSVWR